MADSAETGHRPLTRRENLLYSAGELAPNALVLIVSPWVLFLYRGNPEAGLVPLVSGGVFAAVFLIGRIIDGISDPLVGWWSDRTRTRWGRRKPFLTLSFVPLVLFFVMLWTPPLADSSPLNGFYLFVMISGFFLAFTCYYGPYLGLLPELTPTAAERNSVSTNQALFKVGGMVIGAWLFGVLYDRLGRTAGGPERLAFLRPALVVGAVCLVALLPPLFGRRENPPEEVSGEAISFLANLREVLGSRPFRHFVGAFCSCWFGIQLLMAVLPQAPGTQLGSAGDQTGSHASILLAAAILGGAANFPLIKWAMDRYGRSKAFVAAIIWMALTVPLLMFARNLWQAVLLLLVAGPATGGFLVIPHALMADVCDHDSRRTGVRREAVFFGVQGLIIKGAMGLAVPAADGLMSLFGRTADRPGGVLSCYAVAGLAALLGLLFFWGFERALKGDGGPDTDKESEHADR